MFFEINVLSLFKIGFDKFFSKIEELNKEYYIVYKPEYERIKKEALEAKSKKDEDMNEIASTSKKDNLIEFDDGLYKDSDDEEEGDDPLDEDDEVNYNLKRKKTKSSKIKTIPEEEEGK